MKEKLAVIGALILIAGTCYGVFTYLGRYALCEDVKKIDQKVDKTQQIMEYKFKAIQLETIENRIYRAKEEVGKNPTKADKDKLHDLEQDKKKVLMEMEQIKNQK
jgi:hypothetical protein